MANVVVVGTQWGDEGKGKIVDLFSERFDIVARYQGGHNAGHTVIVQGKKYVLHLIPSGIIHPGKVCVIGNGVVVDPTALLQEIETLKSLGISAEGRLFVSNRSHVIMPYHRAVEAGEESARADRALGTTARGIGPCYEDKMGRRGIRLGDAFNDELFAAKIRENVKLKNSMLREVYGREPLDAEGTLHEYRALCGRIKPFVVDTAEYLNQQIKLGRRVLFEGAQGTLLDVDHGTYPYVTASNATAGGACTGTGVGPTAIHGVVGIAKAYTTRVGAGPFPTELNGPMGEKIRTRGAEYGASTGRPRRCGWFDAVVVRYSSRINNVDTLVITKLDVLDESEEIRICTGYNVGGRKLEGFPTDIETLEQCQPIYESHPGWMTDTSVINRHAALPREARQYLERLSTLIEADISVVSTGPDRAETIVPPENSKLRKLLLIA
ncbi:MAG: adenylosuccinate synthase [Acidobacteria bacterium]|nr:adenylosuccinate synthase [Acidobacteriota bacterium]